MDEIATETLRSLEWALKARKEHDKSASTMTDDFETTVDSILKDGVEYDADDSNTVKDAEKAPYHRLQLIR